MLTHVFVKLAAVAAVAVLISLGIVVNTLQSRSVTTSGSLVVYRDLPTLVRMSDVIVVGTVTALGGTRNIARDPNDATREDPNMTVTAQDFVLAVDTVVKGQVPSTVIVASAKSSEVRKGLRSGQRDYQNYIPLAVGARYALLLRLVPGVPGVYATAFEPSRFELGAGATVRSNWNEAKGLFPPMSTDAFITALKVEAQAAPR